VRSILQRIELSVLTTIVGDDIGVRDGASSDLVAPYRLWNGQGLSNNSSTSGNAIAALAKPDVKALIMVLIRVPLSKSRVV